MKQLVIIVITLCISFTLNAQSFQENLNKAQLGDSCAMYEVGVAYLLGEGVEKNPQNAFIWLRKSAENNILDAQFWTAVCYSEGWGIEKNLVEGKKWLIKAAENGDINSQLIIAETTQDKAESFKYYMMAAQQYVPYAQYMIGRYYSLGNGVNQNYQEALKWFNLAMEQNYTWAFNDLAYLYIHGNGVAKDIKKAFELVNKAIELEPKNVSFYDSKGEFYSIIGERDKALDVWNKIITLSPDYEKKDTPFVQYIQSIKGSNVDFKIPKISCGED